MEKLHSSERRDSRRDGKAITNSRKKKNKLSSNEPRKEDKEASKKIYSRNRKQSKAENSLNSDKKIRKSKGKSSSKKKNSHKKSFSVSTTSQFNKFFKDIDKGDKARERLSQTDKNSIQSKYSSNYTDSKENSISSKNKSKNAGLGSLSSDKRFAKKKGKKKLKSRFSRTDNSSESEPQSKNSNKKTTHVSPSSKEEGLKSLDSKRKQFINPIILNDDDDQKTGNKKGGHLSFNQDHISGTGSPNDNFESFSQIKNNKMMADQLEALLQEAGSETEESYQLNKEQMLQNIFKSTIESKASMQYVKGTAQFDTNHNIKKKLEAEMLSMQKKLNQKENQIKKYWYVPFQPSNVEAPSMYDYLSAGVQNVNTIQDAKIRTFLGEMKKKFKAYWHLMKFLSKEPSQILLLKTRKSLRGKQFKTIIIDLFDTLVKCRKVMKDTGNKNSEKKTRLTVKFRPYLREFLREISRKHEIIVFSSINRKLAEKIVNQIDPEKKYISHLLSEEQCIYVKGVKFKNIDLLKNRKKKNILCVDKSLLPYLNHISNFVPVLPFKPFESKMNPKKRGTSEEGSSLKGRPPKPEELPTKPKSSKNNFLSEVGLPSEDQELRKLLHYLRQILEHPDSKLINQRTLQMQQFLLN